MVRVESAARIRIGRVLDLGAAGVMLPRMDTAAEVAEAVRHLRYPPAGDRGVATYNRACRFALDPGALARAGAEVLGVVQVESASAVEQVDQIAAIEGVDVLFVGPQDLSHNLGVPFQLQSSTYLAAVERVRPPPSGTARPAGCWSATAPPRPPGTPKAGPSWASGLTRACWPPPSPANWRGHDPPPLTRREAQHDQHHDQQRHRQQGQRRHSAWG